MLLSRLGFVRFLSISRMEAVVKFQDTKQNIHLERYFSFPTVSRNIFAMIQNMPPLNMPCLYVDYFKLQELEKQQMQEETFAELPSLPKDTSPRRNLTVVNLLHRSLINQKKLTCHRRGHQMLTPAKPCHKLSYLSLTLLKVHSSFLKIINCPQIDYIFLSFPYKGGISS